MMMQSLCEETWRFLPLNGPVLGCPLHTKPNREIQGCTANPERDVIDRYTAVLLSRLHWAEALSHALEQLQNIYHDFLRRPRDA
jgi:hypothetical protein